ncbi:alpha/beta fold hydrolase [Pedobacter duraquae]|uniref:Pimeloyl-ACP methyl ester carboxylesterase n=1 Tax=Pedobacter duraquae TaxID=425511 RepID=A0A4R6IQM4_9SPHI|nr:alpha/beta fold hydrolase [Pedobacter duraquae]TDO24265.1 pimeloyl-ACP methyl ester carboxylesterase [Pedobacter duraquae]
MKKINTLKSINAFMVLAVLLVSTIAVQAKTVAQKKTPVNTYVLVHGAWAAPYAWKMVKDQLEKKGQRVITVQLPGHGTDQTPAADITMDSYITKVVHTVNNTKGKVILVGHSMAGMIISGVAEQIPDKIEKLVYIAAYVPTSGQSAYAISMLDKQSLLGASLVASADNTLFDVKLDQVTHIFCQDAPDRIRKMILERYRSEPAHPFSNPVMLTAERFGKVPKAYLSTLLDNGIGVDLQNQMIRAHGITEVYKLKSGHCPFLSMPDAVTTILIKTAK